MVHIGYNPALVALSIGLAVFASYTALDLGARIRGTVAGPRWPWIAGAALAMGGGIWSMHFVGMLAFEMGMPAAYDPVHPTQLYEVAWLLPVAGLLWSRRRRSPFLFGEYLALNGLGRLVIENWRVNPKMALGLTEPQWIGIGLIVLGVGGWLYYRRQT